MSALLPLQIVHPHKRTKAARPSVIAECIQPPHIVAGFQTLLDVRKADVTHRKAVAWVLRDLHEEAIRTLVEEFHRGEEFPILAPTIDQTDRKTFRLDEHVRNAAVEVARSKRVTHGAIYHTAFHRYLTAQGVLARAW